MDHAHQGVEFVARCIEQMAGGEIFVPKIPSMRLMDLASALAPQCKVAFVGIQPGEKIHEVLVSVDEGRHAVETDSMFVIQPAFSWWNSQHIADAKPLPEGFSYTSDHNHDWLNIEQFWSLLDGHSQARLSSSGH